MRIPFLVLIIFSMGSSIVGSPAPQFGFVRGTFNGAREMYKSYQEMREANWKNSDKYFHAKANQNAAKHGPGGIFAAKVISDGKEFIDRLRGGSPLESEADQKANNDTREFLDRNIKGDSHAQSQADQRANEYGRNGGNLSVLRPPGLPSKY